MTPVDILSNDRPQTFCAGALIATSCRGCGLGFIYAQKGQGRRRRFCCDDCKSATKHGLYRGHIRACDTCGRDYAPRQGNSGQKFCSLGCRRMPAHLKKWDSAAERERAHGSARRARLRGVRVERFSHAEIFERDGWRCGICRRKVNPALRHPSKMAASLDHIIPLAAGGRHERSNVQCAHWLCNSRKTSIGGGQMKLGLVCAATGKAA